MKFKNKYFTYERIYNSTVDERKRYIAYFHTISVKFAQTDLKDADAVFKRMVKVLFRALHFKGKYELNAVVHPHAGSKIVEFDPGKLIIIYTKDKNQNQNIMGLKVIKTTPKKIKCHLFQEILLAKTITSFVETMRKYEIRRFMKKLAVIIRHEFDSKKPENTSDISTSEEIEKPTKTYF